MAKTNKLYEYGLEAAEVGRILLEPKLAIPTATSDKRRQLFGMGTFYGYNGPPSYLLNNAAIIDAILELYPASNNLYSQIVTQWGTPGCQVFMKQCEAELSKHKTIRPSFMAPLPYSQGPDNEDWKQQEGYIADWIRKYCNRPSDLRRGKPNIMASTSIYLTVALVFRSMADYLKLDFGKLNCYRGEAEGLEREFERGIDSRRRRKIVKLLKRIGFILHYGNAIREGAREWVRARVLSSSFTEYAIKTGQYPNKLRERIRPFDDSTSHKLHPG